MAKRRHDSQDEFILYIMLLLILQILFFLAQPYLLITTKQGTIMATIAARQANRQKIIENFREISKFLSTPHDRAVALYRDGSCIGNLGARFLSIVQIIVSIIALPLILLGTLFGVLQPCFICYYCEETTIIELRRMEASAVAGLAGEQLARIGESLIGAIFPNTLMESLPTRD